jgi:excisionase family DNA binding protein
MKLLTVQEVSKILQTKPKTVYQWAKLGQIPCLKLNGALRFDLDDILAWIKECKKESQRSYNLLTQARGPGKEG